MKTRLFFCLFAILLSCMPSAAQQSQPPMQPLTFWYGYTINPGKEDEFLDLVKTVGQPVRDKLMADGVVLAWGVQVSLLRVPGTSTHWIWYAVGHEFVAHWLTNRLDQIQEFIFLAGIDRIPVPESERLHRGLGLLRGTGKTRQQQ